jgi:tetratricopeptide (TPR) repeat protein
VARRQDHRAERALARAQQALEHDAADASAWRAAALAMLDLGREGDAQQALERLLLLDPDDADALLRLGVIHARAGRPLRAAAQLERAVVLRPDWAEAWLRLGTATFRAGRILEAEAPLRRALELDPGLWAAAVSLASVLERSRRPDEARALLAPLVDQPLPPATVAMTWAGLQRRLGAPEQALPVVQASLRTTMPAPERALLLHALGDVLDDLGRWQEAFEAFDAANRGRGFPWDAAAHSVRVDRLIDAFSHRALAGAARAGCDTSRAVLIVGLPRSGTTLLEQLLSSHSQIAGAGELDTLRRIGQRISRAAGAPGQWFHQPLAVDRDLLDQCATAYLGALEQRAGAAPLITDKMPDNFLQLGLAALMLPGCRVIHVARDPVDSGWSCFRQPFGPGLAWSCSIADIAAYQADHARIMTHWRAVLALPVLELRYEDLIGQPEASLRRVLGFLGLDFEPACLAFHRSERLVTTASHAQVQQPLHGRAVGRAQPYLPWLGPLLGQGS